MNEKASIAQHDILRHLAAGVAHDFNNVLGALAVFSQLLEGAIGPGNMEAAEYLSHLQTSCRLGQNFTANLQVFSGRRASQREPLQLAMVVDAMQPFLRRIVSEDITLQVEGGGASATILAERKMVEQIVINCTINAREAMADGGVLRLAVTETTAPGAAVDGTAIPQGHYSGLVIQDSGAGIAAENLPRLCDPFFTTKSSKNDIGLGLAVAGMILRDHHGHLQVASTPGQGSTFTFYFPVHTTA